MRILLYGVPGSGKTTISGLLAQEHGLRLVSGDYLRDVAKTEHTKDEDPFAYTGTCQAWAEFGALTPEHATKGLRAVRKSMQPYVVAAITSNPDCIFEVAFLDPHDYLDTAQLYLITTPDEQRHRKQFFQERMITNDTTSEFTASRLVQDYLISEAKALNVPIIVNDGVSSLLLEQFK